jgi:hypothetical protein
MGNRYLSFYDLMPFLVVRLPELVIKASPAIGTYLERGQGLLPPPPPIFTDITSTTPFETSHPPYGHVANQKRERGL